jgi:3-keto-5-aminohexanoate cleavage enzyme
MSAASKVIINAAITGMVPMKADNPHVPVMPDEIAADAKRCVDAGAAIVHLHARADDGTATYRRDIYEQVLRKVRAACPDVVLCVSTSGRVFKTFAQRSEVLDITTPRPEMASLTLGSMNFAKQASVNEPEMIQNLARRMLERGVLPELEVFEIGMAEYAHYLVKLGVLRAPFYCNILLGNLGTLSATPANLATAVAALPQGTTWAAAGIGRFQHVANLMALERGGHVRVGLEDNLWFDDERTKLASNATLVERIAAAARVMGREPASPAEARRMIGLQPVGVA